MGAEIIAQRMTGEYLEVSCRCDEGDGEDVEGRYVPPEVVAAARPSERVTPAAMRGLRAAHDAQVAAAERAPIPRSPAPSPRRFVKTLTEYTARLPLVGCPLLDGTEATCTLSELSEGELNALIGRHLARARREQRALFPRPVESSGLARIAASIALAE